MGLDCRRSASLYQSYEDSARTLNMKGLIDAVNRVSDLGYLVSKFSDPLTAFFSRAARGMDDYLLSSVEYIYICSYHSIQSCISNQPEVSRHFPAILNAECTTSNASLTS